MKRRDFLRNTLVGATALLPGAGLSASSWIPTSPEPLIPIWEAAVGGHWNIVKEWLQRDPALIGVTSNIEINESTFHDVTLLHEIVSSSSNVEMMKYLIALGADVNARMCFDWTPLHCASISNDNMTVLKYLVSAGADVNAKDDAGWTPLHSAANISTRYDRIETVKFLIDSGADLFAKNGVGELPLCLARQERHSEVVKYLVYQRDMRIGQNRFEWEENL